MTTAVCGVSITMQVFNRYVPARSVTVFGFETALITVAVLLATYAQGTGVIALSEISRVMLITAVFALCLYYNDMYDLTEWRSLSQLAVGVLQGIGIASIALGAVAVLLNYSLTAGELTYIGRNCAPKVWFCDSRTAAAVEEASSAVEGA